MLQKASSRGAWGMRPAEEMEDGRRAVERLCKAEKTARSARAQQKQGASRCVYRLGKYTCGFVAHQNVNKIVYASPTRCAQDCTFPAPYYPSLLLGS
jgi:hypothetical protein